MARDLGLRWDDVFEVDGEPIGKRLWTKTQSVPESGAPFPREKPDLDPDELALEASIETAKRQSEERLLVGGTVSTAPEQRLHEVAQVEARQRSEKPRRGGRVTLGPSEPSVLKVDPGGHSLSGIVCSSTSAVAFGRGAYAIEGTQITSHKTQILFDGGMTGLARSNEHLWVSRRDGSVLRFQL